MSMHKMARVSWIEARAALAVVGSVDGHGMFQSLARHLSNAGVR